FEEAAFGIETEISVPRVEVCPHCHGNKAEPGTPIRTCPECGGTGEVRRVQQTPLGRLVNGHTCPRRRGGGQTVRTRRRECRGAGVVRRTRRIRVKVPAGIEDGQRIRLAGEGEGASGAGPRGTCTSSSPSVPTRSSAGKGATSTARFPSASCRRPWAMR